MSQNITLLGASYSDVPAVTLPKTGGGTARFTDVTDTTATTADVAQGKYFYLATGERVAGTATGDVDIPTFTVMFDSSWSTVQSVTCDKTRTECAELYFDGGKNAAALVAMTDGTESLYLTGNATLMNRSGQLVYAVYEYGMAAPSFDLEYNTDESINFIEPSYSLITKTITANGTYTPPHGYVWSSVTVAIDFVTYHTSTSEPTSSQGSDGDIWLVTE